MEKLDLDKVPRLIQRIVTAGRVLQYPFSLLFCVLDFIDSSIRGVLQWIRMWWMLLPVAGPFDRIPLVWNLLAHVAISRAGPQLDYNVGVFNTIDGIFYNLRERKIFKVYLGFTPFVTVSSADGIAKILSDTHNISKSLLYDMLSPWMGNGLLISSGPAYRKRRKLITPAFHFKVLEDVAPIMDKHSEVFCSKLKGVVDVMQLSQVLGLDIITETAMGIELNAQLKPDEPYVRAVYRAAQAHMHRVTRPWLWNDFIYGLTPLGRQFNSSVREMHSFVSKVINDRFEIIKADPSRVTQSFLDTLITMHLDHPEDLSLNDLRDEVHTFMFAGHDTTATAIAFGLYMMGLHPEVQQRVHAELDAVFEDENDPMTLDKLKKLDYLEATIKESQRLYPSAPLIARRVDRDVELGGFIIPRGATLNLFSYGLHRDPKHFPQPLEFRPERFLRADGVALSAPNDIPPFAFFPFSGGMRNCIGQKFAMIEMKTILAKVLRRFRLKSLQQRDELELAIELIVRPKNGLKVLFQPRVSRDKGVDDGSINSGS